MRNFALLAAYTAIALFRPGPAFAAETGIKLFRRKFEGTASELEEAALDAETRAWARPDLKRVC